MERSLPTKWKVSANKSSRLWHGFPGTGGPWTRVCTRSAEPQASVPWLTVVHTALGEVSPCELCKVLVGAKNHMFRGWEKNPFFFTSCCIMNSPFQGMCEFLLGLSECCKIFSVNVCPSFQTNGFLCIHSLLVSTFPSCGIWFYLGKGSCRRLRLHSTVVG